MNSEKSSYAMILTAKIIIFLFKGNSYSRLGFFFFTSLKKKKKKKQKEPQIAPKKGVLELSRY